MMFYIKEIDFFSKKSGKKTLILKIMCNFAVEIN